MTQSYDIAETLARRLARLYLHDCHTHDLLEVEVAEKQADNKGHLCLSVGYKDRDPRATFRVLPTENANWVVLASYNHAGFSRMYLPGSDSVEF